MTDYLVLEERLRLQGSILPFIGTRFGEGNVFRSFEGGIQYGRIHPDYTRELKIDREYLVARLKSICRRSGIGSISFQRFSITPGGPQLPNRVEVRRPQYKLRIHPLCAFMELRLNVGEYPEYCEIEVVGFHDPWERATLITSTGLVINLERTSSGSVETTFWSPVGDPFPEFLEDASRDAVVNEAFYEACMTLQQRIPKPKDVILVCAEVRNYDGIPLELEVKE